MKEKRVYSIDPCPVELFFLHGLKSFERVPKMETPRNIPRPPPIDAIKVFKL